MKKYNSYRPSPVETLRYPGSWMKAYDAPKSINMALDMELTKTLDKCKLNSNGDPIRDVDDDSSIFTPYFDRPHELFAFDTEESADRNDFSKATPLNNIVRDSLFSGSIGRPNRPFVSTRDLIVRVGVDTQTIQEALDQIPVFLRHGFHIRVEDGKYPEHLIVPTFFRFLANSSEGKVNGLTIVGNDKKPKKVKIYSIFFSGGQTERIPVSGFTITKDGPYADKGAGIEARSWAEVVLRNIRMRSGEQANRAICAYGGMISIKEGVDIGDRIYKSGFVAKTGGVMNVSCNSPAENPNFGVVRGGLFNAQEGSHIVCQTNYNSVPPYEYSQFSTDNMARLSVPGGGTVVERLPGVGQNLINMRSFGEDHGQETSTTDSNGEIVIPHGARFMPNYVSLHIISSEKSLYHVNVKSVDELSIVAYVFDASGLVLNKSVSISWLVKMNHVRSLPPK